MGAFYTPGNNKWSDIGQSVASNAAESYFERSDEMALKKAIEGLDEKADPKTVLNTILGAKTYGNAAKEKAYGHYLQGQKLQADKEQKKELNKINEAKNTVAAERNEVKREEIKAKESAAVTKKQDLEAKELKKEEKEINDVQALYKLNNPNATPEEIKKNTSGLSPSSLRALTVKPENVHEYDIAKNRAKYIEPRVENIQKRADKSKQLITPTENAIIANEKYTTGEKYWDAAIQLADNSFLNVLKTATGQQLAAYTPIAITNFSDKMGGVLSVKKLQTIEKKAVTPEKDKDTNRLFLYLDLFSNKIDALAADFTDEIIGQDKYGLPPADFQKQLDTKLYPYRKMVDSDVSLLLQNKKPVSEMAQLGVEKNKKQPKPGYVFVESPEGIPGQIPEELLLQPQYAGFKRKKI